MSRLEPAGLRAEHRIVGIQHQQARRADNRRDGQLHVGKRPEVVDPVLAEMVCTDVHHDGGMRARHGKTAPQDPAARRLQHGRLDASFAQHRPRADRTRVVAAVERLRSDEKAVGAAVSGSMARGAQASRDQPHRGRLAIRARHQRRRHIVQLRPGYIRNERRRIQWKAAAASATADRDHLVVEQPRQVARLGCIRQRAQVRARLRGRQHLQPRDRRLLVDLGRQRVGAGRPGLDRGSDQRLLERAPVRRIAVVQRRAQRPLVQLGRGEQLVERRGHCEGHALRVPTSHDARLAVPAEPVHRARDARTPLRDERIVGIDADDLEHGTRRREEQVVPRQSPRVVERQGERDGQSSVSGA